MSSCRYLISRGNFTDVHKNGPGTNSEKVFEDTLVKITTFLRGIEFIIFIGM